mgnify:CR=1 FL=1
MPKLFTDEQLERACNIDLADMLRDQGEILKRRGRVYYWQRYDSTAIYGNKWYRHSREIGGGPIQFMQHFYDMDFIDAVKYLLNGEEGKSFVQTSKEPEPKPEFKMPELSKNMHRTFAYLIKTRKIDADVIQHFVDEKKIQETQEYHNVAFCGYDENSEMKQMHLRSTIPGSRFFQDVEGSDKQYYFRHDGVDNKVYVFESPIDMLSYITLHKENWQQHSYVCLGGVAMDALNNILKNHPQIDTVYLCVDNDIAGDKAVKRIGEKLTEKNIQWQRLLPENKDWNEDLVELRGWGQSQNFDLSM